MLQLTAKLCYEKKNKKKDNASLEDIIGEEFAETLTKARKIVSFINKSSQAKEKLLKKQALFEEMKGRPKSVITDVVTRWWSTYSMIDRLLELRPAINLMGTEGHLGDCPLLVNDDWSKLENMLKVLKPFKGAQKLLEGDSYVTSSWVPQAISHVEVSHQFVQSRTEQFPKNHGQNSPARLSEALGWSKRRNVHRNCQTWS